MGSCVRAQENKDSFLFQEPTMEEDNSRTISGIITKEYFVNNNSDEVSAGITVYCFYPFAASRELYKIEPPCYLKTGEETLYISASVLYQPVVVAGVLDGPLTDSSLAKQGIHSSTGRILDIQKLELLPDREKLITTKEDFICMDLFFDTASRTKDGFLLNGFVCAIPDTIAQQCTGKHIRIKGWPHFFLTKDKMLFKRDKDGKVVHLQGRPGRNAVLHVSSVAVLENNRWKIVL